MWSAACVTTSLRKSVTHLETVPCAILQFSLSPTTYNCWFLMKYFIVWKYNVCFDKLTTMEVWFSISMCIDFFSCADYTVMTVTRVCMVTIIYIITSWKEPEARHRSAVHITSMGCRAAFLWQPLLNAPPNSCSRNLNPL